ncbi:ABC transporter substrate-binding protein [Halosolutus gelatinilyticus]|uniref:ABC transporter substrate-binding protein n=1 Tax=Halosolutus gelatinilyticus TaxID=2931975 RepID=UPI001FF5451E
MLAALGGTASVSLAGCSALLSDDGDEDDGGDGGDGTDGESYADKAQAAWERIQSNPGPDAQDLRNEAYVEIEEAVRDDMIMLNFLHDFSERFWYDYVDVPKIGPLGQAHQQLHTVELEGETELNRINSTHNHIDPVESDDEASSTIITQVYERLVEYPNGVPEIQNQLLDDFELSDDNLTYTFHLKEGVPFHTGGEMTAHDVKYSWRRVIESENSVRANFMLDSPDGVGIVHEEDDEGNPVPDSAALEVIDDYTLEMEVRDPNPAVMDVLTYTAFSVIPEGLVGDIEGYDGEVGRQEFRTSMSAGTGPFELDEFAIDEELRLTRFDDYHRDTASVESVHFEIVEDDEARYTYAMEKNADIFPIPTQYYDPNKIDAETDDMGRESGTYGELENGETVNYLGLPELVTRYFGFNARNVPKPVRQAIAYVTDQEEIVNQVFAGRGVPAYSFTPPGIWPTGQDGYEKFVEEYPYSANETDIEGAKQVLEEAGYTSDDPYELTCTTYESVVYQEAAGLLRDKLSGNGVEIELDQAQFATLQQRGYDGDLEMYSLGWGWSWESVAYGHFGFEPKNTDTSGMPGDNNGYYLDWHVELSENDE